MWLKSFFYLQKNDRQGAIALLLLALISVLLIFGIGGFNDETEVSDRDSLANDTSSPLSRTQDHVYYQVQNRRVELFPFDPNTADSSQFLRLGLQPWQVRNIYKYRAAGGIYRKPSDFARLYGLTKKQFLAMEPYIKISNDYAPASELFSSEESHTGYSNRFHRDSACYSHYHSQKLHIGQHIALNSADTSDLKKVPGIGSGYARAIVNYRNRLGGFVNTRQLLEIGGVPESSLSFFSVSIESVHKVNVNKLSLNQLRRHPYINYYIARDICDFRRLHGPIKNLSQLRGGNFTEEELIRLEPYVEY